MEFKKTWTEADVNALIGQSESIRLEFKSGGMFAELDKPKWADDLSKQVSAFANTEGGELILGVREEKKGNTRVAIEIDGVPTTLSRERLQQLIEGNLSPDLPSIHFHVVKLSAHADRVVFVIQVPPGNTAYQANDGRYYGRSEFEVKHLRDRDIRLRMSRGRIAQAKVYVRIKKIVLGADQDGELRAKHADAFEAYKKNLKDSFARFPELVSLVGPGNQPDEITYDFVLKNDGELTIRDPAVKLSEVCSPGIFDGFTRDNSSLPPRFEMQGQVIYPGDERDIADYESKFQCRNGVALSEGVCIVKWKIFLDNSPASEGAIDLGAVVQNARTFSVSGKQNQIKF